MKYRIKYFNESNIKQIEQFLKQELKEINIPNIDKIRDYAFYKNTRIERIIIPDTVISIGRYAFGYCSSLTSITIPSSVEVLGEGAFYNCSSLESIYYDGTIEEWNKINLGYAWNDGILATKVQCSDGEVLL